MTKSSLKTVIIMFVIVSTYLAGGILLFHLSNEDKNRKKKVLKGLRLTVFEEFTPVRRLGYSSRKYREDLKKKEDVRISSMY